MCRGSHKRAEHQIRARDISHTALHSAQKSDIVIDTQDKVTDTQIVIRKEKIIYWGVTCHDSRLALPKVLRPATWA